MKHEIDNNAMWEAFRQELALQGELHVIAAIDNALNNLGFTIKENGTIVPFPLKQGKNNISISEVTKQELEDNLHKALEKETEESWNEFLDEQGEQKPAEDVGLPEFESYLCLMLQKFRTKGMYTNGEIIDFVKEHSQKLRDILAKPIAWSEEDEEILNLIIARLHSHPNVDAEEYGKDYHWLKSLKERVQPKQEWSEQDEERIKKVMHILSLDGRISNKELESIFDWLKSLRPQSHWKPSDEQMDAIEGVVQGSVFKLGILESLYQDLKELKG